MAFINPSAWILGSLIAVLIAPYLERAARSTPSPLWRRSFPTPSRAPRAWA
jgi:hypothetical protein